SRLSVEFAAPPDFAGWGSNLWNKLDLRVTFDSSMSSGSDGNVGGAFDVARMMKILEGGYPDLAGAIYYFTPLDADLPDPSNTCPASARGGGGMGWGAGFELVSAVVTKSVSGAPAACTN